MNSLYDISNELRSIYNQLENGEGVDLETGEIKPEVQNALALTSSNLQSKAIDYGYMIKSLDDESDLFAKEIKRLQERKKQIDNLKDKLCDNLSNAMQEFGIVEIKGKTIKLSFRKSESVEVSDASVLDEKFQTIVIQPNKSAIKQAIKNGEKVEGARIVEKQNLQIKWYAI